MSLGWRALAVRGALHAVLAVSSSGCRARSSDARATDPPISADSLEVTLATDKPTYRSGEPVQLTLTVTNRATAAQTLEFSSSQRYDFKIEDSTGTSVWAWSADRMFAQMMGTERLAPGESRAYRERFSAPLSPGTYRATGVVTTTGVASKASAKFTIRSGG